MSKEIHDIHKELGEFLVEIKEDNYHVWYMFTQDLEAWLTVLDEHVEENEYTKAEEVFDDILNLFDNEKLLLDDNTVEIPIEYIEKWYKLLG